MTDAAASRQPRASADLGLARCHYPLDAPRQEPRA